MSDAILPDGKGHGVTNIGYSRLLGRIARSGEWSEQARTTFTLLDESIRGGAFDEALRLVTACVEECRICYGVLRQWQDDIAAMLVELGQDKELVDRARAKHCEKVGGSAGTYNSPALWSGFRDRVLDLQRSIVAANDAEALEASEDIFAQWRTIAAGEADLSCAIIDHLVQSEGETVLPGMWDRILGPLFSWRYQKFDAAKRDWDTEILPELLYVALEAERTWLSTPGQSKADIELEEHSDRFVMRFDPCGTGGRALLNSRRDAALGKAASTTIIEGAYPWTDGKAGVCSYCNHCQVLMEHWPIEHFGYPLRVVEPPLHIKGQSLEHARCQWTMYKDPHSAPAEVYERCGRTQPVISQADKKNAAHIPDGVWVQEPSIE